MNTQASLWDDPEAPENDPTGLHVNAPDKGGSDALQLCVLGSGSKGNASLIIGSEGTILIDNGFSAKELLRRMSEVDVDPASVQAILVTHEHSDHIGGLGVAARKLDCPVYATAGTFSSRSFGRQGLFEIETIRCNDSFSLAGITVIPFRTSHDAAESVGFRFEVSTRSIGFVTDTGVLAPAVAEMLQEVDVLALESNHDPTMLTVGPYPYHLKRRIRSDRGHLSNEQAGESLEALASNRLQTVVGMHLSQTNNMPLLGKKALQAALDRIDHPAQAFTASQSTPMKAV